MRIEWINYLFRFLVVGALQVLFFNHINVFNVAIPFFYVIFFITLPVDVKGIPLLLIAFLGGLTIDVFTNTLGMHSTACLTLAFARPYVLELLSPREGYEFNSKPSVAEFGTLWFIPYGLILIVLHHFVLFSVEALRFAEFFWILGKTLSSAILTLLIILLAQSFNAKSTQFE